MLLYSGSSNTTHECLVVYNWTTYSDKCNSYTVYEEITFFTFLLVTTLYAHYISIYKNLCVVKNAMLRVVLYNSYQLKGINLFIPSIKLMYYVHHLKSEYQNIIYQSFVLTQDCIVVIVLVHFHSLCNTYLAVI